MLVLQRVQLGSPLEKYNLLPELLHKLTMQISMSLISVVLGLDQRRIVEGPGAARRTRKLTRISSPRLQGK